MMSTITKALAGLVLGAPTALPAWVWAAAALPASPFPRARARVDRAGRRLALLERARVARFLGGVPGAEPARGRLAPYLLARSATGALTAAVLSVFALGCVAALQSLVRGPGPDEGPAADWYDPLVTAGALLLALALGAVALAWAARTEHELTVWAFSRPRAEVLGERVRELARTRSEVLEAVAEERRRIERDLHDGLQQRLLSLGMLLGGGLHTGDGARARDLFLRAHEESARALAELRDVAWRIHPVALDEGGLPDALDSLAERTPLPVEVVCDLDRRPAGPRETAAYFVVSEAVGNAVKHSGATRITVVVTAGGAGLRATVTDDGRGGADPGGPGLRGLARRVAAVDGTLRVDGPPGGPTTVEAVLPCAS